MTRSVPEWIGKNDDQAIPPRVRLRVFKKFDGRCQCDCNRPIRAGEQWRVDHVVALVLDGEHRESNLQPILTEHDRAKVRREVAEKSATYKTQAHHLGIRKSRRPMPGSRASGFKRKMNGQVERRA